MFLLLVRNIDRDRSVRPQQVSVDGLLDALGRGRDALVLELDLAPARLVVLGTNVRVIDAEGQDHVVEGRDVEVEGFVPDGVDVALLDRGLLVPIVLVSNLNRTNEREKNKTKNMR